METSGKTMSSCNVVVLAVVSIGSSAVKSSSVKEGVVFVSGTEVPVCESSTNIGISSTFCVVLVVAVVSVGSRGPKEISGKTMSACVVVASSSLSAVVDSAGSGLE